MLACVLSATALATTAFVGTAVTGATTTNIEYTVARNDSSRKDIGEPGRNTKYYSYDQMINDLPNGTGVAYVSIKGYPEDICVIADSPNSLGEAQQAKFYIQKPGQKVICIGHLNTGGTSYPLRVDENGIIYASTKDTYETYILNDDATNLEHKDYIQVTFANVSQGRYDEATFWGYLNDSYRESTRIEIDESGSKGLKNYQKYEIKTKSASPIIFKPIRK